MIQSFTNHIRVWNQGFDFTMLKSTIEMILPYYFGIFFAMLPLNIYYNNTWLQVKMNI